MRIMECPTSPQMWGLSLIDDTHSTLAKGAEDPIVAKKRACTWFLHATIMQPKRDHGTRETHTRANQPRGGGAARPVVTGVAAIRYCFSYTAVVGGSVVPAVRLTTFSNLPFGDTVQVDWSNGFPLCVRVILKLRALPLVMKNEAPDGIVGPSTFPGLPSNAALAFSLKSGSSKVKPFSASLITSRLGELPLYSLSFQVPAKPCVPAVRT
jgi:hypothetical protein